MAPAPGLTRAQRGRRLAAAVVALALLLAGSTWGADDHFPFGPMKMYAYANKPNGVVTTAHLRGVT
ncbi:MAG TPA: hypothetical protein VFO65_06510, partial [Acidimicrobiales bacterium]|nr:hypothetical protein [Acidimicrobiales bacterium]